MNFKTNKKRLKKYKNTFKFKKESQIIESKQIGYDFFVIINKIFSGIIISAAIINIVEEFTYNVIIKMDQKIYNITVYILILIIILNIINILQDRLKIYALFIFFFNLLGCYVYFKIYMLIQLNNNQTVILEYFNVQVLQVFTMEQKFNYFIKNCILLKIDYTIFDKITVSCIKQDLLALTMEEIPKFSENIKNIKFFNKEETVNELADNNTGLYIIILGFLLTIALSNHLPSMFMVEPPLDTPVVNYILVKPSRWELTKLIVKYIVKSIVNYFQNGDNL